MRKKWQRGHRRQYIAGSSGITHYDLLVWRNHAMKLAGFNTTQIVHLVRQAKTSLSGTASHERVQDAFSAYVQQLGFFRRLALVIEVKASRVWSWFTNKDTKNYGAFRRAAA